MAVGSALLGIRPVVEIMYGDFCTLASDPLVNHAAKIRFMSAGQLSCPMVLRAPMGSGTGHGSQHTQSLEGMFSSIPGLVVVAPSTPKDAKALLKSAIRSDNPVLFFEHKLLYGITGDVADDTFMMPLGKANVKQSGTDVTLVCYSRAVSTCLEAARKLSEEGIFAEVLDLCTLRPLDTDAVLSSVGKTGRLVMVQESPDFGGYGSAVVSVAMQDAGVFSRMRAHPLLLSGKDCPIPFQKELEETMVPSVDDVVSAVRSLL
jgi:pyruvate/2-oxoglutarate/acetoin dehydrogenase E1 component